MNKSCCRLNSQSLEQTPPLSEHESSFLSTAQPTPFEKRLALAIVLASMAAFVATAPFAKTLLSPVPAFLPVYQSVVIISDIITFILLLGQYDILRSRSVLVIACGYLFSAAMAIFHALSFPGLFAPSGLLGAGPQTTAWLYFFWHGGFPLFVIAYVTLKGREGHQPRRRISLAWTSTIAGAAVLIAAAVLMLLATSGARLLPEIMNGNLDRTNKIFVAVTVWILCLVALGLLWRRTQRSLLDMWLMATMCIWIFDVALAAVLNHGRYDVGWYMGRVYGLMAASFVLLTLLLENGKLYAQLASSSARERAYLRHLDDPIVTIDADGVIRSANPALERVLGYSTAEVRGQNFSLLLPETNRSEHDEYFQRYLRTREADIIDKGREVFGQHKSGELVPLALRISEVPLEGEESQFIGTLHDLRDRNRLIEKLTQARADAERANEAKSAFLATMSHEIRTPLTGMLGMLELLSLSRLDNEQRATLDTAWDSSRNLLRIVNDILDWSKIEEGKLELAPRPTSIQNLLQEVVNTYSRVASIRALTLWQHSDVRLGTAYIVDPLRLSQVLNNFVSNAIKFTQSGEVELRAELVERFDNSDRIRFSVKDTGPGIRADVQSQLFQRYRQESADTARMYGGTGLGLAICRLLGDLLDGQIGLQSELGKGSTFSITLTLPVSEDPVEVSKAQNLEVRQREVTPIFGEGDAAPLVLAVDDHPTNRDLLSRQLRMLGLRATTAENGHAALSRWKEGGIALIITDCHMPGMNGYELSREVRRIEAEERLPHTPIIAWTANALAEEQSSKAAGMDEILLKPANMTQLSSMLRAWLLSAGESHEHGEIDYSKLDAIIADPAAQDKLLEDFLVHIDADRSKLSKAFAQEDRAGVQDTAHRMHGSSRMVGATHLATTCAAIESAAKDGQMAKAAAGRAALDDAIERLRKQLSSSKNQKVVQ